MHDDQATPDEEKTQSTEQGKSKPEQSHEVPNVRSFLKAGAMVLLGLYGLLAAGSSWQHCAQLDRNDDQRWALWRLAFPFCPCADEPDGQGPERVSFGSAEDSEFANACSMDSKSSFPLCEETFCSLYEASRSLTSIRSEIDPSLDKEGADLATTKVKVEAFKQLQARESSLLASVQQRRAEYLQCLQMSDSVCTLMLDENPMSFAYRGFVVGSALLLVSGLIWLLLMFLGITWDSLWARYEKVMKHLGVSGRSKAAAALLPALIGMAGLGLTATVFVRADPLRVEPLRSEPLRVDPLTGSVDFGELPSLNGNLTLLDSLPESLTLQDQALSGQLTVEPTSFTLDPSELRVSVDVGGQEEIRDGLTALAASMNGLSAALQDDLTIKTEIDLTSTSTVGGVEPLPIALSWPADQKIQLALDPLSLDPNASLRIGNMLRTSAETGMLPSNQGATLDSNGSPPEEPATASITEPFTMNLTGLSDLDSVLVAGGDRPSQIRCTRIMEAIRLRLTMSNKDRCNSWHGIGCEDPILDALRERQEDCQALALEHLADDDDQNSTASKSGKDHEDEEALQEELGVAEVPSEG